MTHVRTSPFYPQSNGKVERWHQSLKSECIRPLTPLTLEDARRLIQSYVDRYNHVRLHSAIGYVIVGGRHWHRGWLASSELQYPRQVKRKRGYAGTQPC